MNTGVLPTHLRHAPTLLLPSLIYLSIGLGCAAPDPNAASGQTGDNGPGTPGVLNSTDWTGGSGGNPGTRGDRDQLTGALCIGLTPPESAWPPPAEPEPDAMDGGEIQEQADGAHSDDLDTSDGQNGLDSLDDALHQVTSNDGITLPGPGGPTLGDPDANQADGDARAAAEPEPPPPCRLAPATCVGAFGPEWQLPDFQPQSCGFEAIYGLELYENHVTVVALLAAW